MSDLKTPRGNLKTQREAWKNNIDQIYGRRQSIAILQERIRQRLLLSGNLGKPEAEKEWATILALEKEIKYYEQRQPQLRAQLAKVEQELDALGDAQTLIGTHWRADLPVLLLPLRVQTRFVRVKHMVRGNKEYIFDSSGMHHKRADRGQKVIRGIAADEAPWTGEGPKKLLTLGAGRDVLFGGGRFFKEVEERVEEDEDRRWLQPQEDTFELLVRIYPDEIALHGHEENLMVEEVRAGQAFWKALWRAELTMDSNDPEAKRKKLVAAWKILQDKYLPARAAYIYRMTKPANFPKTPAEVFRGVPDFSNFKSGAKSDDWTRPLESRIMPDHLVVHLYGQSDQVSRTVKGERIPHPLPLSHDPLTDDTTEGAIPDEIRWITEFEAAEKVGMAIRIPLSKGEYDRGFAKLVVLGVNLALDEGMGKTTLEELLLNHQYKQGGMGILPQGTPTNNFERERSGYTFSGPPAEAIFQAVHEGIIPDTGLFWTDKKDGHFLAQLLGIDPIICAHLYQSNATDISGALAMNHLLWPATGGYFLDQFMQPLLDHRQIKETGEFFRQFVSARGFLPALHIGNQPYGILATTAYSRLTFSEEEAFLSHLFDKVFQPFHTYWGRLVPYIQHVGKLVGANPASAEIAKYTAPFVEMIGLHASSETFYHRPVIGEYFLHNVFRAHFSSEMGPDIKIDNSYLDKWAIDELDERFFGKNNYFPPEIRSQFKTIFRNLEESKEELAKNRAFGLYYPNEDQMLTGAVIDQLPVSDRRKLSNWPGLELNYLEYLYQLDVASIKALFQRNAAPQPQALLYLLARQALGRACLETAIQLSGQRHRISIIDFELEHLWEGDAFDKEQMSFVKKFDPVFETNVSIEDMDYWDRTNQNVYKSILEGQIEASRQMYKSNKWNFLNAEVAQSIDQGLKDLLNEELSKEVLLDNSLQELALSKASLRLLSEFSTGSLQLLFTEHLDLCNYRLDAWMQGVVHKRLFDLRRFDKETDGIYLGAYGYLENIKRRTDNEGIIFRIIEKPEMAGPESSGSSILETIFTRNRMVIPILNFTSFEKSGLDPEEVIADAWIYLGDDHNFRLDYDGKDHDRIIAMQTDEGYNQGFMHTPSRAHAMTAAILRSGHMANNPAQEHDAFAVNLSSNSVRNALYLIEGVKNGQGLPELLGYQFERYLHDNASGPLDRYILTLRRHFPLTADQLPNYDFQQPIEKQEAANVVDGRRLVKQYRDIEAANNGVFDYVKSAWSDFGIGGTDAQLRALFAAMQKVSQNLDQVSDLLLSESVFQVAKGDLQGAATALKMFNNEVALDTPEIVETPRRHKLLSQLVGIQFDTRKTGLAWPGIWTPRALINPGLNRWLEQQLPRPHTICVNVVLSDGQVKKIKVSELGWKPLSELPTPLPPVPLQPIDFLSLFQGQEAFTEHSQLSWLIRMAIREKYPEEKHPEQIVIRYSNHSNLTANQCSIYEIQPLIQNLIALLEQARPMLPDDLERETVTQLNEEAGVADIDNSLLIANLEMIITQVAWIYIPGFVNHANNFGYRLRRTRAASFPPEEAQLSYNNLQDILFLNFFVNYPGNFFHRGPVYSEENREWLLQEAVAAKDYFTDLQASAQEELNAIKTIKNQRDQWEALEKLTKRIFGESFFVTPQFRLPNAQTFTAAYEFPDLLTDAGAFAVEEWLQGLAQVRKPLKTYQQLQQLRNLLDLEVNTNTLQIIQLPFEKETEKYRWLGVKFSEDTAISADTLSLALELPANYQPAGKQAGMVIDFWREAIPEPSTTSGIAMHYDQPNSEPPQTLLLCVAPNATTGTNWQWEDLLATVNDTMDMAKKRAVDPDLIAKEDAENEGVTDVLKHILPGVLAPICQNGETPWADFGINNVQETEQS